jgi:nicotinamide-nucleotide amidase
MTLFQLATQVIELYSQKQKMIALGESCTGGLIAAALTDISGSSAVLDCGFVTYSNQAKIDLLGVNAQTIQQFGAVSEQTAIEMAKGLLQKRPTVHVGLSVTGIAGPGGGSPEKPVGRVHFGLCIGDEAYHFQKDFENTSRKEIRDAATAFALNALRDVLY